MKRTPAQTISFSFPKCACGGGFDVVHRHAHPTTNPALAGFLENAPELPGITVRCDKCGEEKSGADIESLFRRISPAWGEELDRLKHAERLQR